MKNRARLLLIALALAVVPAGCVTISQPSPKIRDYRLDYPPPSTAGELIPVVLTIRTLAVSSAYDRESIVYREGSVAVGRYFYHRWTSNPGALIADLLERDFAHSGLYTAVQSGRSSLRPDYQLTGTVEEIEERSLDEGCSAHLALRFQLVRTASSDRSPIVLQDAYSEDEPSPCNDPQALVQAMSLAMARIAASLEADVHAAILADRANQG